MAEQSLHHTISLLTRTAAALDVLLRDLPETRTHGDEGEGTMSASSASNSPALASNESSAPNPPRKKSRTAISAWPLQAGLSCLSA
jgi:hypothetical protein